MIKSRAVMPRHPFLQKLAVLIAGVPWLLGGAQAQEKKRTPLVAPQTVSHRCGGVGADSMKQLKAQANDFNLGFWMVGGPGGTYLADVPIQIESNGRIVTRFIADGPLCYVRLPAGSYTVTGTHNGQTRSLLMRSGSMNNYLRW